ncbi:CsbD family protein [Candidatus Enterococcus mangumiae]|uniref:CsbD family protein n=1 Tax=Candidatus Enterococcus mangumiae TaxID=2230878 RepID=A0ABZ2T1A0_9ENTE|nr:CsbD family protein [Enterococcus sp. DIV1094]MBO0490509.1 CsbD family protein [Enterococcus sp. DIV1094]
MGTFKNQKDKVVGSAKEKIGEIFHKEDLLEKGQIQAEEGKIREDEYRARIAELEDQHAEKESKRQDLTKERQDPEEIREENQDPQMDHRSTEQKIEEERMKRYTGIEEKL